MRQQDELGARMLAISINVTTNSAGATRTRRTKSSGGTWLLGFTVAAILGAILQGAMQ